MKSSLSAKNTFLYIKKLLESYLPDSIQNNNEQLEIMVNDGLDRLEFSFSKVKDKYFNENGIPVFNHLNSDHMVVLIYYIGNSGFRSNCDKNLLEKAARETGSIVTCEEHNVMGGFGSAVSEVISESYPVPISRIGVQDKFGESARDNEIPQLFEKHGITSINIANTVKQLQSKKQ